MMRLCLMTILSLAMIGLLPVVGAADDIAPGTLAIQVVHGETGKPIKGAQVSGRAGTKAGVTMWTKTVDEHGRATLKDIRVKTIQLRISAEGFVAVQRNEVKVAEESQSLRVELTEGLPFDGVVLDVSGKPIPRARVEVQAGGVYETQREARPDHAAYELASTDKDGGFHVRGIPNDAIATVVVRVRGFAQGRVAVRAAGGRVKPQPLRIRLRAGGRVRGRVLDADGKAFVGAVVYVIPDGIEALKEDPRGASPGAATTETYLDSRATDRKGRFAIDGLSLGRAYLARAYGDGFKCSEWAGPFSVSKAGAKATIALTLRREDSEIGMPEKDRKAVRQHITALVATLEDGDADGRRRMEAAQALGKIKPGGIAALIPILKRGDPATRLYAIVGIGGAGQDAKDAVPALITALKDEQRSIRAMAIGALGQIGSAAREAIPALEALAREGSESARGALAKIRAK